MSVWAVFGDFFTLLFPKDPASARKYRDLRSVYAQLKTVKPAIFAVSGKRLQPAFAQSVFGLAVALKPLRDASAKTVAATDQRIALRYRDFLVEKKLGAGAACLLDDCSYEALAARVAGDPKALDAAAEDFRVFLKGLDGAAGSALDAELGAFDRAIDLCRFDFSRLLGCFDTGIDLENPSYKPRFAAAAADRALSDLLDFYAALGGTRIGDQTVDDLAALAEKAGGEAGADARKRIAKGAAAANKYLQSAFSPTIMAALVRAAADDPRYPLPAVPAQASSVAAYKERAAKRFAADRDRVQRELREASIGPELAALFPPEGSVPGGVEEIAGFDSATDARLKAEAACSFAWRLPLSIMKTFEKRYLAGDFLEAAHRLTVEGFFANVAVKSRLVESLSRLEKAGARIAAFEEASGGSGRLGAAALSRLLEERSRGKSVDEGIERIVSAQDARAKEMTEGDVAACRAIAEVIYEVIADFRKPTPTLVTNIKTLGAAKEKNVVATLANGYNAIARFLKVMKSFMVIA